MFLEDEDELQCIFLFKYYIINDSIICKSVVPDNDLTIDNYLDYINLIT